MTIVGVGDKWKGKFKLGSRYIIQADVYYKGKGVAFGYAIPGGLSQYVVIGTEILEGDEGCYLLPVKDETGFAEAALVEPWTCVIASYQIRARTSVRENGHLHFAGFPRGPGPAGPAGPGDARRSRTSPTRASPPENVRAVEELARRTGAALVPPGAAEAAGAAAAGPTDVVCAGTRTGSPSPGSCNEIDADGVLGVHTSEPDVELPVDVGKVHYRKLELVGSTDGKVAASYRANNRESARAAAAARGSSAAPAPWARCT